MSSPLSTAELRHAIDRVPRFALAHLPTPFEPLRNFSRKLGGPTIWMKRDDCTGLVFGGNKTRHNEFLLGAALAEGADYFVWGAGVQSNNCRQTVAACVKAGIPIHLVLSRAHLDGPVETQGNLLLDHLMGASIEFVDVPVGPELDAIIADRAEQLRQQGHQPFFWNRNPVVQIAALSYVECAVEIAEQCQHEEIEPAAIYVSSCGSTGSGLALGAAALGMKAPVQNIAPLTWPWDTATDMAEVACDAAERLQLSHRLSVADLNVSEDYIAPGYGTPGPDCLEAVQLVARTEAILLDPIYSGKAMAGLIDHIRRGDFSADDNIVFVHTGGTPVLFAMNEMLAESIPGNDGDRSLLTRA
jgi:1-aminocyclopropane-1-carboxylate deaminase/D-cysteine desulfhydrase-like pyridoxal-dependent ACC family enzyme